MSWLGTLGSGLGYVCRLEGEGFEFRLEGSVSRYRVNSFRNGLSFRGKVVGLGFLYPQGLQVVGFYGFWIHRVCEL